MNNLPLPNFKIFESVWKHRYTACYYYSKRSVYVCAPRVADISLIPGIRKWSYPGNRVDRTGFGVVCHEVGHHVDHLLNGTRRGKFPYKIEQISTYEPDMHEAFAETMRIFILNPCLLHIYAPNRCEFIINELGLKPSIECDWDEVLQNAHPRYMQVVRNKLKNK